MNLAILDRVSPYFLLVLTTLFWGGNFNVARAISDHVPPLGLSFWRWTVALLILLPFVYRPMRQQFSVFKQHWKLVLLLSFFGITCFNSLVYLGLQTTTAINGALMQSVNPIMIILFATFLLKEPATRKQWLAIGVSLTGVLVILTKADWSNLLSLNVQTGDLFVLTAVITWGLYTTLLRKLPNELKGLPILGYSIAIGVVLILPFYLWETTFVKVMPISIASVGGVLYTALFASILAYMFWNHATHKLGAARTGQFTHLIPVFGILIATFILDEQLFAYHGLGILLVASGLVLANWKRV